MSKQFTEGMMVTWTIQAGSKVIAKIGTIVSEDGGDRNNWPLVAEGMLQLGQEEPVGGFTISEVDPKKMVRVESGVAQLLRK